MDYHDWNHHTIASVYVQPDPDALEGSKQEKNSKFRLLEFSFIFWLVTRSDKLDHGPIESNIPSSIALHG